jgi:predicted metallo-beta-lactamase superfamily hydrolase
MNEAIKSINKMCGINDKSEIVKDSHVVQTMRYLELIKELKKSGNKNKKTL